MSTSEFNAGGNPVVDHHPLQGNGYTPGRFMLRKRDKLRPDGPLGL